jgi:nicotinamide mononucleotide (NMN) deamidase PncC
MGIAETGIAGPAGGGDGRPVGLFWVAVSTEKETTSRRFEFGSDRAGSQESVAEAALNLALEVVAGLSGN